MRDYLIIAFFVLKSKFFINSRQNIIAGNIHFFACSA
jgi:hypothetical protein